MSQSIPLPVAITMGDPAGIGGELTLKAWDKLHQKAAQPFFVIDCPSRLKKLATDLSLNVPVREISSPIDAVSCFGQALPVISEELHEAVTPGVGDPRNGSAVINSIKRSVGFVQNKEASAVVTNPINKAVLYQSGFNHPGHTEYLADLAKSKTPSVMMLASKQLRVIPVTIHLSLAEAINKLDSDLITHTIRTASTALKQDFGIRTPRIAVSGLNPHAGEDGTMGSEEIDLIIPTLELLRKEGIDVRGPLPADTMFHAKAREGYDVAVCMYHDQALIPIKTLDFDNGVNITLGLPFIRTSPDHGTAYNIAGQGIANPNSFIAAIEMATTMARAKVH
ncbi:4-hydroxythreonine-4-phosphate dehydrogenase PdxA [uncultured Kiloniella sp.]|uniref:4-hydroxythreonine-4-phosphate dehydrogenase PdxA n=1 Tax=uncultured Kiloniella sp. TaxID=1133091 RepID=UPI002622350F|nr:4-hydroxythreonine-4-phosphate dehydrogenase PdxA [uncultured Kiloniella sp.]